MLQYFAPFITLIPGALWTLLFSLGLAVFVPESRLIDWQDLHVTLQLLSLRQTGGASPVLWYEDWRKTGDKAQVREEEEVEIEKCETSVLETPGADFRSLSLMCQTCTPFATKWMRARWGLNASSVRTKQPNLFDRNVAQRLCNPPVLVVTLQYELTESQLLKIHGRGDYACLLTTAWSHSCVWESMFATPDSEIVSLSFRPLYLPGCTGIKQWCMQQLRGQRGATMMCSLTLQTKPF